MKRDYRKWASRIHKKIMVVGLTIWLIGTIGLWILAMCNILSDELAYIGCSFLLLIMLVGVLVAVLLPPIAEVIVGTNNIRNCDDDVFEEIDKYVKRWGYNKNHYERVIKIINLLYSEYGRVNNEIVSCQNISRLYARLDFLKRGKEFERDFKSNLLAFVISLGASFTYSILSKSFEEKNIESYAAEIITGIIMFIMILLIFAITVLGYANRGKNGDWIEYVREYEIGRITEYIKMVEKNLSIGKEDEKFLENQNVILQELIDLGSKKIRHKTEIVTDIDEIENLNLCLPSYKECILQRYEFQEKEIFLLTDKKGNWASGDYEKLYEILNKGNYKFKNK